MEKHLNQVRSSRKLSLGLLLLFLSATNMVWAQTQTTISGSVKDKKNEPVIATVTLQAKDSKTISSFTTTNAEGMFTLTYKGQTDSLEVVVSGLSVGRHSRIIANRSDKIHFVVEDAAFELNEITVKPPKISQRGDTINYNVNAFTDQSDRVIGDVLKKMPGIKVADNGSISYNGTKINKFYVENMDLLQGRYGIATENISAKDVATVQVLENHQPIKALRDKILSDEPAINLRLKESAKGTWAVTGLAGLGYQPLLWEAEATGMYFAKNTQNITTYKGNNTGKNIFSELNSHYDYERVYVGGGSILSIQSPASPPVSEKRYRRNQSNTLSSNHLVKINEDLELTTTLILYNDRTEKEGYSRLEQFLDNDSTLLVEERINSTSKTNNAELALRLNSNSSDYYFNNALNLKGNWNNSTGNGSIVSNVPDMSGGIAQHLHRPSFSADNTTNWIKNIKSNALNIHFSVGYGELPHTLTVTPASYFGDGIFSSLSQHVLSKEFASVLRMSYSLRLNDFTLDYGLSENISLRNIDTELQGMDDAGQKLSAPDSLRNELQYNNYLTTLYQSYTFNRNKFKTTLILPLTYYLLTIDDRIPNRYRSHNKWIVAPSLSAYYDLSGYWQLSARGSYGNSYGNINDAYTGLIMHNYRSLVRNTIEELYETRSGNAGGGVRYSNPLEALFGGMSVTYRTAWRNLLYGYNYQGVTSVKTVQNAPTRSESYGVNMYGQKAFDFWKSNIRISTNYSTGLGEILVADKSFDFRSQNYSANMDIQFYPYALLGITYGVGGYNNRSFTVGNAHRFQPIYGISQNLRVNIFATKAFTITLWSEHQYNSATTQRNMAFGDASITYKKKPFDLELEVNNIFNTKQYISASYNDISSYFYSSQLRPLSVLARARFKLK